MIRSTIIAAAALTTALLAGCSGGNEAMPNGMANEAAMAGNLAVEDLASDSLAAPSDMPLDTESNGAGSASGGNAM